MSDSNDPFFAAPEKPTALPAAAEKPATMAPTPTSASAGPPNTMTSPDFSASSKAFSIEEANEEIAMLLESGKVTMKEVSALQGMMREHLALRDKVSKLKSLLGRSAKAQREAKVELEQTQKRLVQTEREVDRLTQKVEKLANRPTHMDLLQDFETNFDRALLSVPHTQTGGENPASTVPVVTQQEPLVDSMLLQELGESRARIEHLEALNSNLQKRASHLEQEHKTLSSERDSAQQNIVRLQLELRMAQMEADHASRAVQDKMASLAEMQLEIDLVTKASMNANVRAKQGEEAAQTVKADRQQVQQLQMQVTALEEWALASAESKQLAMDRVRLLEQKLKHYEQDGSEVSVNAAERAVTTKSGSLVIGAGDDGFKVMELGQAEVQSIKQGERVLLRWKFDLTPCDQSIEFSLLKGKCDTPVKLARADYLIKNRLVTGGAAGETESAFAIQNACTLMWSNKKSWVRPRAVKYTLEVVAVTD